MSVTIQNLLLQLKNDLGPSADRVLTELASTCYIPMFVTNPAMYSKLAKTLREKGELEKEFPAKVVEDIDNLPVYGAVEELLPEDVIARIRTLVHSTTLPASSDPVSPGMAAALSPLSIAAAPAGVTQLHGLLVNMLFDKVYGDATHALLEALDGKTHTQMMEFIRLIKLAVHDYPSSGVVTALPAGTTEAVLLATKLPDISSHRVGPYWFNKVLPKKANFQMSHGAYTCIKVGEAFKEVRMDVRTEEEVANIQAVIDGLGATHGGRRIKYCDAPYLTDVKRMVLCLCTLEMNSAHQWVFKTRLGATRYVNTPFFRNDFLHIRQLIEASFFGITTMEALNLAWDLELYDNRNTKYAKLFDAVRDWLPVAQKSYAADVLNFLKPDTESSTASTTSTSGPIERKTVLVEAATKDYAVIMSRQTDQENNRKVRNTIAGTDVFHHNATLFSGCHETSEIAARIIPVLKRFEKYFPKDVEVHIDSQDGSNTIQQYFSGLTPPVKTVNKTADGKFEGLNEKAPLAPNVLYVGDWNESPERKNPAGVFSLLKSPALVNVRTVILRCDPKKMKFSRHGQWVATLTEALEHTGFDKFAWLNSGRMHTPHFYVMFTREDVNLMKNFPLQFRNVIVPEVCTVASYCERLVHAAYKVGIRPDMSQFLLDLKVHFPKMALGTEDDGTTRQKLYTYLGKSKAGMGMSFDTQIDKVEIDKLVEDY